MENEAMPRALVMHFAAEMERQLNEQDPSALYWKHPHDRAEHAEYAIRPMSQAGRAIQVLSAIVAEVATKAAVGMWNRDDAARVLAASADVANLVMMIADICGALPPTDMQGR